MRLEPSESSSRGDRLQQVIADYLTALRDGQDPDRHEILARHPDLDPELEAFFADHDRVKRLARPFTPAAAGPDPAAATADLDQQPGGTAGYTPGPVPTLASEPGPPAAPAPGTRVRYIGDYEVLGELGRGGMGVVYQARQRKLGRLVALKMVLAGEHAGTQELARFRAEAEAVARLQHPHVVQIYEIGEHEGHPYFSLEFCPEGSLDKKLNGTPLPARQAAQLVEVLARAMHAAHHAEVIHRDLKPANVLLVRGDPRDGVPLGGGPEGEGYYQPKVTDFGLAKRLGEAGQTASGAVVGTPSYMAPEQAAGKKEVGPPADVYALGAILYECLTGRPPFKAATPLDTILQVVGDEPVPPRQLNPKVPRDLETICLKCLHKEPRKRYASAAVLAEDLRRFQAGESIAARPVGPGERLAKWVKRRPAAAALLGVSVLAAAVLVTMGAYFLDRLARERNDAIEARTKADEARTLAERQRDRAEWLVYAGKLALAQREWQDNNVGVALDLLKDCQSIRRGWEHGHLWTRFNSNQRTFLGHTYPVLGVACSPDGKRLASAGFDGTLKVWDADKGTEVLSFKGHEGEVAAVCFSPGGKRLASAGRDHTVKVWDADTGQVVFSLKGHTDRVRGVRFSPDGKRLASGGNDSTVKVWDAATGREIRSFKGQNWFYGVRFSPDGKRLAMGCDDGTVRVWDADTGQEVISLKGHTNHVTSVCFSPDGKRLASGGNDTVVKVWDVARGEEVHSLNGHRYWVTSVAFSPDGKRIVSGSEDSMVKVWDALTGKEIRSLKGHTKKVTSVAYSPDGKRIISGSWDKTLKVWGADKDQEAPSLKGHTRGVTAVCFSPDGKRLASGSSRINGSEYIGEIMVWDMDRGQEVRSLKGHAGEVTGVCFSPDGKRLASAGRDRTVKVWDADTYKEIHSLKGHTGEVAGVCFSPDGKRLASAGQDHTVKVWDTVSGEELLTLKGHSREVTSVSYSPDGGRLATGSHDNTMRVWDSFTGREIFSRQGHTKGVSSVCFSRDGKRLASAGWDNTVKVWDADKGQEILSLKGHTDAVLSVCFSPDGKRLASASLDRTVKVWETDQGLEVLSYKGHTFMGNDVGVSSVCFSPDGKRLTTSSYADDTVKVWEADKAPPD